MLRIWVVSNHWVLLPIASQLMCSLANVDRLCTCHFLNNAALQGLLTDSFASIKHLLTVTALTGNFRFLEVMIGWIVAILTILRSVLAVQSRQKVLSHEWTKVTTANYPTLNSLIKLGSNNDEQASFTNNNQIIINTFYRSQKVNKITNVKSV